MSDETPNAPAPDDVMTRIGHGIEPNQRGEKGRAHALFMDLWSQIGPDGEATHRCALAHSTADTCDDPQEELREDLEALRAADSLTDDGQMITAGLDALRQRLHAGEEPAS